MAHDQLLERGRIAGLRAEDERSILRVGDRILGEGIVSHAPAGHSVTAASVDQAAPVAGGIDQSLVRMNGLLAPEPHHIALVGIPV
jgi:hypothetical protein